MENKFFVYSYNKNSLSTKNLIASFDGSFESCLSLKLTKVHLVYNSRSDKVCMTSLAIASRRARIKGPESTRQDSIASKGADNNVSAIFFSFGLHVSILSPTKI